MNDEWREGLTDEELFEKWQGLVLHVIHSRDFGIRKSSWDHYLEDLQQEGAIGLWKAIRTYNSSIKCGWKHYACICIERQIRNWSVTYINKFDSQNPDKAISYDDKQPGVTNYNSSENSNHRRKRSAVFRISKFQSACYKTNFCPMIYVILKPSSVGSCR